MTKVSIIMPTYNVEKYYRICLESVINQTLKDIEIITVDDGSPDNCGKIMDEYAKKDKRIKPIHKANGGYGSAVNAGLAIATGDYIGIVETDDCCEPTMFEKLYNKAEETDADVVKCYFNNPPVDNKCRKGEIERFNDLDDTFNFFEKPEIMLFHASVWCGLYKKSMLDKNNIKMDDKKGSFYQDFLWTVQCYYYSKKISLVKECLYNWRVEPGQNSSTNRKDEKCFNIIDIVEKSVEFIISKNNTNSKIFEIVVIHGFNPIYYLFSQINESLKEKYYNRMRDFVLKMRKYGFKFKSDPFNTKEIFNKIERSDYDIFIRRIKIQHKISKIIKIKEKNNNYKIILFGIRILKIKKKKCIRILSYFIPNKQKRHEFREKHLTKNDIIIAQEPNVLYRYLSGLIDYLGGNFKTYILENNMKEKVAALKRNLDDNSLKLLDNLLKKIITYPNLSDQHKFFINYTHFEAFESTSFEKQVIKEFFENIENYKKNFRLFEEYYTPDIFYFHHGLYYSTEKMKQYIENKDFIDGGAYIGDSVLVLNKYYNPKCIHSFEISPITCTKFTNTMKLNNISDDKYKLIQKGISDKKQKTYINDTSDQGTNVVNIGNCEIELTDIDSYVMENNLTVGFIKSDIEGSGIEGLKGMKKTIKKDRPVLSLSIYHNPKEFFEMKPLLEEITKDLNYKIEIKHLHPYVDCMVEVIIWAYPAELI